SEREPFEPRVRCLEDGLGGRPRVVTDRRGERELAGGRKLASPDIDLSPAEVPGKVRSEGLRGRDRLQQAGREEIEGHDLPVRLRARNPSAVERGGRVSLAEASDEDVLPVLYGH